MAETNYWTTAGDQGKIRISEDVVASIASITAAETQGVSSLYTSLTSDIVNFLGKKNLSRGVKVQFDGQAVAADVGILVRFGHNIQDVARAVQTNVKNALESMTGLHVAAVNVLVGGVSFDEPASESDAAPQAAQDVSVEEKTWEETVPDPAPDMPQDAQEEPEAPAHAAPDREDVPPVEPEIEPVEPRSPSAPPLRKFDFTSAFSAAPDADFTASEVEPVPPVVSDSFLFGSIGQSRDPFADREDKT